MEIELLTKDDIDQVKIALVSAVQSMRETEQFVTPDYVEEKYGFKLDTQAKWRSERRLPYYRVGKNILYDRDELAQFIRSCRIDSVA